MRKSSGKQVFLRLRYFTRSKRYRNVAALGGDKVEKKAIFSFKKIKQISLSIYYASSLFLRKVNFMTRRKRDWLRLAKNLTRNCWLKEFCLRKSVLVYKRWNIKTVFSETIFYTKNHCLHKTPSYSRYKEFCLTWNEFWQSSVLGYF